MTRFSILGTAAFLAACGAGGSVSVAPTLDYGSEPLLLRIGETVTANGTDPAAGVTGGGFTVSPPLPAGLQLDAGSGAITGTPTVVTAGEDHAVTGTLAGLPVTATVRIAVGRGLPAEVASLEQGFAVERFATLAVPPAKLAIAPDGRVFVSELGSGVVRLIDAAGILQPTPFATVPVVTGTHRGLLGIALSPTFASDGLVYAIACTPGGSGPDHSVLYRWHDVGGLAADQTVLRADLPMSALNNGGALCFDANGWLLLSIGDAEQPALAQDGASLAGKILRLDPNDGSAAADNPTPGDPVVALGLRNTFAIARDPVTDLVWFADNGPANDDELDLLQPGHNYEWGAGPGADFGSLTGTRLRLWHDVVVPTGVAFRDATDALDWPAEHERSVYVTQYDGELVERFELSGPQRTDIDREVEFLRFAPSGNANKPLDVLRGPDGQLWVLTFTAIYRIDRIR